MTVFGGTDGIAVLIAETIGALDVATAVAAVGTALAAAAAALALANGDGRDNNFKASALGNVVAPGTKTVVVVGAFAWFAEWFCRYGST